MRTSTERIRPRGAATALLCAVLLAAGAARAGGIVEPEPQPPPEPAAPVPDAGGQRLFLTGRLGGVFATTPLRPPVGGLFALARTGEAEATEGGPPAVYALGRVTPNPVLGRARIGYDLPATSRVTIEALDIAGRIRRTLVDGPVPAGRHSVEWDGTDASGRGLAPGIYFLRMDARAVAGPGGIRRVDKVLVLR